MRNKSEPPDHTPGAKPNAEIRIGDSYIMACHTVNFINNGLAKRSLWFNGET